MTIHDDEWHCGCCSLKGGCRLGAIWTIVEALGGIALLVSAGLIADGNPTAIAAVCYFAIVFCFAWILLAGIFRESLCMLWSWIVIYTVFLIIRLILMGFLVTSYIQYVHNKPVTFEVIYLSDGTSLRQSSGNGDNWTTTSVLFGVMTLLGVSVLISGWILIGVIYLTVGIRRRMWSKDEITHVEYARYR